MNGKKFFWLNLASAAVWAALFGSLCYVTRKLITEMATNLHRYEWWIAGGLGLGAALIFGIRWLGARRPARL